MHSITRAPYNYALKYRVPLTRLRTRYFNELIVYVTYYDCIPSIKCTTLIIKFIWYLLSLLAS